MKKVLYVTANPKAENKSFGLQVGRKFIEEYKRLNPEDEVTEIEVYDVNVPLVDRDILSAWDKLANGSEFSDLTKEESEKLTRFNEFTEQFMSADKYVFVTPMWNLGIPAMMKAYLDTGVVAGKTFKYTANGPVGLLEGKKAVHIHATGGVYSVEPGKSVEHSDSYVRTIANFIGIKDIQSILVEGMAYSPDKAEEIKDKAIEKAIDVVKTF
ncbi:FMN-dependent NADH-azoreductase [uncultured Clostridium sp.]|uniref:FMN-dependent NADH-azoreductase n=1 Tax=uncultured Clostridium sp. TaxID=59620 RepID=UPI0026294291|nr:FMN-dependent NADH-azoreductase [uncultured Clostridium sp.]